MIFFFVGCFASKSPQYWLLQEGGTLIGRCGLSPFRLNDSAAVELGYYISPQYQRQGFGYEAASRTLLLARERYGLTAVYARVSADNVASLHLIRRHQHHLVMWIMILKKE